MLGVEAVLGFLSDRTGMTRLEVATARLVDLSLDSLDALELLGVLDGCGLSFSSEELLAVATVDELLCMAGAPGDDG